MSTGVSETKLDPDIYRNVSELISSKGYPVEEYSVHTSDGFILSMQRIPRGRKKFNKQGKKKVVLLIHGLLATADCWVLNFPEQSLGFVLADEGYDVWLGNTRGNTYSRKHEKYTPDQSGFWDFSFDEVAKYDLPAMIDYVLNATGEKRLYYIGHSQGTTAAFALLSENAEYNDKIKLLTVLAPVATIGHMSVFLKYIAPFSNNLGYLMKILGENEFLPNGPHMEFFKRLFCVSVDRLFCEDIVFAFFGADKKQLNETRLGVYAAHFPAGSSTKSVVHYGQMVNSKKFTKFDYGQLNMDHYHQENPPEYDVSLIKTPVALLWAPNDHYADPEDVDVLQKKLKSVISSYQVPDPQFNHIDFIMAVNANRLVYDRILSLLNKY